MYNQFCKNIKNYIRINSKMGDCDSLRLKIAKDILPLTDVNLYKDYKKCNDSFYKVIEGFIYAISKYKKEYPSFNKFIWELWAYGFDSAELDDSSCSMLQNIDEKVKLIDLLLSTHYFS